MRQKRNKILYTLAVLGDILEEIHGSFGLASIPLKAFYGFVPPSYRLHHFKDNLDRALKVGNIDKIVKKGEVYFRLTGRGKEKFMEDFPLISFYKKRWDKRWRILIFDIEEAKKFIREKLREKLYSLGFGKLQQSVYISPFPIEEEVRDFLDYYNISAFAKLFVTETFSLEEGRKIADEVWDIEKINDEYSELLEEIENVGRKDEDWVKSIKSRLVEVFLSDPFLPKELLPDYWSREKVIKRVKNL